MEQERRFGGLGTFRHFRLPVRVRRRRAFFVVVAFGSRVVVARRDFVVGGLRFLGSLGAFVRGLFVGGVDLVGLVVDGFGGGVVVVGVVVVVVGVLFFCVLFVVLFFCVFVVVVVVGNVSFLVVVVGGCFGCLTVRGDGGGAVDGRGCERDGPEGGGRDFSPGRATAGGRFGVDLHLGRRLLLAVLVGWRRLSVKNSVFTVFVRKAFRWFGCWGGHFELEDDSL